VYPQHHGQLQRAVGHRGLLLSEQPPGAQVHRGNFAGRNRLLVALAAAVVVVECPPDSGALHSAAYAWEQGLPLWVVPGDAGRHAALGSNRLLCQGATPLLAPEDLVAFLGPGPLAPSSGAAAASSRPSADPAGSEQERLLAAVGEGASLEQISLQLGRPASELAVALFQLEWEGMLRAQPGLRWQRC
jgi:DNA processing protein